MTGIKGLDNFTTHVRIEDPGIDHRIVLEASSGSLSVMLGNWNTTQARAVAQSILETCEEAENMFKMPPV